MSGKTLITVPRESITRECSVEAFQKVVESGKLEKTKLRVYETLYHHGPLTQEETWLLIKDSKALHEPDSKLPELRDVTPSFAPLERQGLIKCLGGVKSAKNTTVSLWDVTCADEVGTDPLRNRKGVETSRQKMARLETENALLKCGLRFYSTAAARCIKLDENARIRSYHNHMVKSLQEAGIELRDKEGNLILTPIEN
jgi:hypothetical protein